MSKYVKRNDKMMEGYSFNRKGGRDLKSNVSGLIKDFFLF